MSGASHPLRHTNPGSREAKRITTAIRPVRPYVLRRELNSRSISQIAAFAALYAVLVWLFQPISFAAVQFRVAEGLKPAIAKKGYLAVSFAIGNFLGNLISPNVGIYELGFMPFMNLVGGILAYEVARIFRKNYLAAALVYAPIIALSVSWMLHVLFRAPLEVLIPPLLAAEAAAMIIGAALFWRVEKRWKWYL